MALTVLMPNELCLAGNPILVKATTDKSLGTDESFLRIVCEVSVWLGMNPSGNMEVTIDRYEDELSQPVGNAGTATFNLSDTLQTLFCRAVASIDMNAWDYAPVGHSVTVKLHTSYLYDNQEIKHDSWPAASDAANINRFYVVDGRLTDYEMLSRGNIDMVSLTASGKLMTRKPDLGIIYRGETVILPTLCNSDMSASASLKVSGATAASSTFALTGRKTDYQWLTPGHASDGEATFSSNCGGDKYGYYRTNTRGVHFLRFINGFGAVENIAVRAKDKLSYEVSGETHSLVQEISTRPTDRRYATKSQPVGVYELSSGYVPVRWAEWYVQELLTSPRVWIQIGDKWVPALIEAEDDCVIYDRTKPEMPHVDFTLRLAIDGVTGCVW